MEPETLKNYYNKIKWVECPDFEIKPIEKFPASPGYLLIELIKRYKIPFKALGYHHNIVGIRTKKQAMLWRDTGIGATFLGLINLDNNTIEIKEDTEKPQQDKPFNSFKELSAEIKKRDYNNILGLKATITEEDYYYFLEVLPPLKMGSNWFILGEALSDERYYKFIKYPSQNIFICEVVQIEQEELIKIEQQY